MIGLILKIFKTNYVCLNLSSNGFELVEGVQKEMEYYSITTHYITKQKLNNNTMKNY